MTCKQLFSFLIVVLATATLPMAAAPAPSAPLQANRSFAQLRVSLPAAPAAVKIGIAGAPAQIHATGGVSATDPVLPASYFGMHVLHLQTGTAWPAMKFGTWRLWDSGVAWRQLQPTATTYNWQTLDTYVALAQQQGVGILLVLGQTPQWASARPNEAGAMGNGAAAEPTSNTLWTNYVTAVAKRYKGKIAYYEVWNEANSKTLWTGTPTELVQLTSLASKAIKSVDPAARIISPSIGDASPSSLSWLKQLLDVGLAGSIDEVGVHFYVLGKTPEAILPSVQATETLLQQYKADVKPLFNTEFGWAAPTTFNNVDDQSAYLMRSLLVGWGAGIQQFMWYAWDNANWVTVVMSTPDFKSPTQVAKAYVTLENWTANKEVSRCAVVTGMLWSCNVTNMAGDHSRIYWSATGTTQVTPSLTWTPSKQVDMYGNTAPYKGGQLTVTGHPILITE